MDEKQKLKIKKSWWGVSSSKVHPSRGAQRKASKRTREKKTGKIIFLVRVVVDSSRDHPIKLKSNVTADAKTIVFKTIFDNPSRPKEKRNDDWQSTRPLNSVVFWFLTSGTAS